MVLARLVAWINARHGTAFEGGPRYQAGEQGAFALVARSAEGERRAVLTWQPGADLQPGLRDAVAVTERLRAAGYPAPRSLRHGVVSSVQEALPGEPPRRRVDARTLDRLLELHELRRGRALPGPPDWPAPLLRTTFEGGDGCCLLEPMRRHSTATWALLDELQQMGGAACLCEGAPSGDVVHFDFRGGNILLDGGEVSGVVDWQGTCAGDRAFDLATLFFCQGGATLDDGVV